MAECLVWRTPRYGRDGAAQNQNLGGPRRVSVGHQVDRRKKRRKTSSQIDYMPLMELFGVCGIAGTHVDFRAG